MSLWMSLLFYIFLLCLFNHQLTHSVLLPIMRRTVTILVLCLLAVSKKNRHLLSLQSQSQNHKILTEFPLKQAHKAMTLTKRKRWSLCSFNSKMSEKLIGQNSILSLSVSSLKKSVNFNLWHLFVFICVLLQNTGF